MPSAPIETVPCVALLTPVMVSASLSASLSLAVSVAAVTTAEYFLPDLLGGPGHPQFGGHLIHFLLRNVVLAEQFLGAIVSQLGQLQLGLRQLQAGLGGGDAGGLFRLLYGLLVSAGDVRAVCRVRRKYLCGERSTVARAHVDNR